MDDALSATSGVQPPRLPLTAWLREGLRASILLRPRIGSAQPAAWQMAVLVALASVPELGLGWFAVTGSAVFDPQAWLAPWWTAAALLLLAWATLPRDGAADVPHGALAWFSLWLVALLPVNALSQLVDVVIAADVLPDAFVNDTTSWGVAIVLWAWTLAIALGLALRFAPRPARALVFAVGVVAVCGVAAWQFPDHAWQQEATADEDQDEDQSPQLTQETFEAQQALLAHALDDIEPTREPRPNLYGVVFSPDAEEDVFLNEGTMVRRVLDERFDGAGRVVQLANNRATSDTLPWATPLNLRRTIDRMAGRMDRDKDVLLVYLTSHGASDFQLAASNPPMHVDPVSPGELREALDQAGIRNRVVVVSACYSGGWIGPLAGRNTLVITAADATHTSYGCGRLSSLTFFGRAMFAEQLRHTHSFEQAFARAVPVIRRREDEAGKDDGFSDPQISVGAGIRPVLQALAERLDRKRAQ